MSDAIRALYESFANRFELMRRRLGRDLSRDFAIESVNDCDMREMMTSTLERLK